MAKPIPISIPAGLDEALSWLEAARDPDRYVAWLTATKDTLDKLNAAIEAVGKIDEMDSIAARIRAKLGEAEATQQRAERALADSRKMIEAERFVHEGEMGEARRKLAADMAEFAAQRKTAFDEAGAMKMQASIDLEAARSLKAAADKKMAEAVTIKDEYERKLAAFKAITA